ncbi:MAG: AAA family ATPase [Magnetococcales bacterium]|nr:AAA family ATPase [Magnetococcales bacterium]
MTASLHREAYLDFVGLERNPFPVAPDSENLFMPARLDDLINEVLHSILTRRGFLVLTGEVGLGKTTISKRLMNMLDQQQVETALVFNTFFQGTELLDEIIRDFGADRGSRDGLSGRMEALNQFLLAQYALGHNCALIIDDAQNLSIESLELVRMISNLEANAEKLVQILLIGQTELADKLATHEMRQLKSRVVMHAKVHPFDAEEVKQYIFFRLGSAGHRGNLHISDRTFQWIYRFTHGTPREINKLMDRCLYGLFAEGTTRLSPKLVREVAGELGMVSEHNPWQRWPLLWQMALSASVALSVGAGAMWWLMRPAAAPSVHWDAAPSVPAVQQQQTSTFSSQPAVQLASQPVSAAPETTVAVAQQQQQPPPPPQLSVEVSKPDGLDEAVQRRFLGHYGLMALEADLAAAWREQRFDGLAEKVAKQVGGYRLIRMSYLPESVAVPPERWLRHVGRDGQEQFLFFWKPDLWVGPFNYNGRSDVIKKLQEKLQRAGFDTRGVDGIVGPATIMALVQFQKRHHLPVTGHPDGETMFMLSTVREEGNSSAAVTPADVVAWVVQVASVKDQAVASLLAESLRARGFSCAVELSADGRGDSWYTVRVGPWRSRQEADAQRPVLIELTKQGDLVTMEYRGGKKGVVPGNSQ